MKTAVLGGAQRRQRIKRYLPVPAEKPPDVVQLMGKFFVNGDAAVKILQPHGLIGLFGAGFILQLYNPGIGKVRKFLPDAF